MLEILERDDEIIEVAEKFRALKNDPTYQRLIGIVEDNQVKVFKNANAEQIDVDKARAVVLALSEIENVFTLIFDEEKIFNKKHRDAD